MADIKSHASLTTSLISYWDLEEASGTRYDLHGSNHLTDNNTVTRQTGKVGNCAKFTSANSEYLEIADASQTGLEPTGDMSWSFWVYFDTVPGAGSVAGLLGKGDSNSKYQIAYSGNGEGLRLLFYPSGGTYKGVDHAWTPSATTWYHVVVTFNSTASTNNFQIFINNSKTQRTGSGAPCGNISGNSNPFRIGAHVESLTYYLNGRLEEMGMWNKVLSDTEVSDLYNSGNGLPYYDPTDIKDDATLSTSLVSYWKLDETSGTRNDSHGSNHLTDNNTVLYGTGKIGNGADFEDTNSEYLNISDASQSGLDITGDLSFSCWIKPETTPSGGAGMAIMYKWASGSASYGLIYIDVAGTKKIRLNIYQDGSNNLPFDWTVGSLSTTSLTHVAVRFDVAGHPSGTGTAELFVNGVSLGTVTNASASSIYNGTGAFSLSSLSSGIQWYWDGIIDEAGIYSKVLTTAEVRALYGYGTPPEYDVVIGGGGFTPRFMMIS